MIMEHEASRIYLFGDISHDLLVGGLNPPEKNISQLGLLFPIYGKIIQMCLKPPTSDIPVIINHY